MLSRSKGFTLIELLVVISIIGMLSSVVMVGLSSARDKATKAAGQQFDSSAYQAFGADAAGIWNFDGNAADQSAYQNNGTATGVYSYDDGIAGQAICFTAGSVNLGHSSAFDTDKFTIAFWIKPTEINSGGANKNIIFGRENYTIAGFRMGIDSTQGNTVRFWTDQSGPSGGGYFSLNSSTGLQTNQYSHVAVTYNGSAATIYINGKASGTKTGTYSIPNGSGSVSSRDLVLNGGIGGVTVSKSCFDNVRFYTQSITAAEVWNAYAAEAPSHRIAVNAN